MGFMNNSLNSWFDARFEQSDGPCMIQSLVKMSQKSKAKLRSKYVTLMKTYHDSHYYTAVVLHIIHTVNISVNVFFCKLVIINLAAIFNK